MQDTSTDKNLIDHPNLVVLLPYMHSYCEKGITNFAAGKDSFSVSTIETYASGVFERVAELDTALISLLHESLSAVAAAVNNYRGPRNELIHSNAYSSRELGIFMGVEQFNVDTGSIDIKELKRDYSSTGAAEIEQTIGRLVTTLTALLDELGSAFSTAHEFSLKK